MVGAMKRLRGTLSAETHDLLDRCELPDGIPLQSAVPLRDRRRSLNLHPLSLSLVV